MIGVVPATGNGFRGLVSYLLRGSKDGSEPDRVDWAETMNLAVDDPDLAVPVMRATARQAVRCTKPVYHMALSWHQDEQPTRERMRAVALELLAQLGLDEHQGVMVAHKDKAHKHLHMVINRVDQDSLKAWDRWQDYKRIEKAVGELALKHGFHYVPGRHNQPKDFERIGQRPKAGEHQSAKRQGKPQPPPHMTKAQIADVRVRLTETIGKAKSWTELVRALEADGFTLDRKGQGLVITGVDGYLKLSELKKDIRLAALETRLDEAFADYERTMAPSYLRAASPASDTAADDQSAVTGLQPTPEAVIPAEVSEDRDGEGHDIEVIEQTPSAPVTAATATETEGGSAGSRAVPQAKPEAHHAEPDAVASPPATALSNSRNETSPEERQRIADEIRARVENLRVRQEAEKAQRQKQREDAKALRQAEQKQKQVEKEAQKAAETEQKAAEREAQKLADKRAREDAKAQAEVQRTAARALTDALAPRPPVEAPPAAPAFAPPVAKDKREMTPEEKELHDAHAEARIASEQADLAFKLYNVGMISRRQLARANRDREVAQRNLYEIGDLQQQINSDVGDALRGGAKPKPKRETADDSARPKKRGGPKR